MSSRSETLYMGSTVYISATVTAAVTLNTQAVQFTFDRGATWIDADWQGSAGTTRDARALIDVSATFPRPGRYTGRCKVVATPEVPIFRFGSFNVLSDAAYAGTSGSSGSSGGITLTDNGDGTWTLETA